MEKRLVLALEEAVERQRVSVEEPTTWIGVIPPAGQLFGLDSAALYNQGQGEEGQSMGRPGRTRGEGEAGTFEKSAP
jgi:hypothetical protein